MHYVRISNSLINFAVRFKIGIIFNDVLVPNGSHTLLNYIFCYRNLFLSILCGIASYTRRHLSSLLFDRFIF